MILFSLLVVALVFIGLHDFSQTRHLRESRLHYLDHSAHGVTVIYRDDATDEDWADAQRRILDHRSRP